MCCLGFSLLAGQFSMHTCYNPISCELFIIIAIDQVQGKVPAFSLSGMKTKLFGSDTAEQKEVKVRQLCDEIVEAEAEVKRTREEIE